MIELNKIYNEDCLEGMKRLDNGSVDLIVTDPPYGVGVTSNGKKGNFTDMNLIKPFFTQLFSEYSRVLKEGGEFYICTDWRTYPLLYPLLQNYFEVKNLIVWDYEWIKAGSHYRFSHEFIIYGFKGKNKRGFSASERDVWRIKPINFTSKNKLHQAQKPVELIKKMLTNSSEKGQVVMDTFLGSGTTAVACMDMDRKFVGFELDDKYFNVANERIKNHAIQEKVDIV